MTILDLSGAWTLTRTDGSTQEVSLPGTLDEMGIGGPDVVAKPWHPDVEARNEALLAKMGEHNVITSRLTRNHTWEGAAHFTRVLPADFTPPTDAHAGASDKRLFLVVERARALSLRIDDTLVPPLSGSLSTPWRFEVTGLLRGGSRIEFTSDNSYPGLPYQDIVFSSAATDESQTNWNGLIGSISLEAEPPLYIAGLRVYPHEHRLSVQAEISLPLSAAADTTSAGLPETVTLRLTGDCLTAPYEQEIDLAALAAAENAADPTKQTNTLVMVVDDLAVSEEALARRWDEENGQLLTLTAALLQGEQVLADRTVSFGLRDFAVDDGGHLVLNGRRIFLRGEANCAFFPETGHPPMDEAGWQRILATYMDYGANCIRFHSWCPPEAAFAAADKLGLLIQPELSHWNPRDAFSSEEARSYYERELCEILITYANHPSFVMLSLGNELHADEDGIAEMHRLVSLGRRFDPTRLYAWGSNNFYGEKGPDPESDFYTSTSCGPLRLRACGNKGPINIEYASATRCFDRACAEIRNRDYHGAIFGFEVGQYQVLPDFSELPLFRGVTRPDNITIVQDRVREMGMSDAEWEARLAATGELSLIGYREDVESAMRTEDMSGLSLLGLQDFPGQGTALVGMMHAHLQPKPYPFAAPERFRAFFRAQHILAYLPRYTWCWQETLSAPIRIVNYGREAITGALAGMLADTATGRILWQETLSDGACLTIPTGGLTEAGQLSVPLSSLLNSGEDPSTAHPRRLDLTLTCGTVTTTRPVWVYPDQQQTPDCPAGIHETAHFDDAAQQVLAQGGIVYLTPPSTPEALPQSVQAQFATDFWSVGTFPQQDGAMGQFIDAAHPLFADFPTEVHTNWQWWPMAGRRAFVLKERRPCIIEELDSYATLRPMAQLFEARCLGGRILVSSMGLQELQQYPEARALLSSIYRYIASEAFRPEADITPAELSALVP